MNHKFLFELYLNYNNMFSLLNLLLFIPLIFLQINCSYLNLQQLKSIKEDDDFINYTILKLIKFVMESALQLKYIPGISEICVEKLDRSFFIMDKDIYSNEEILLAKYYYIKLLLDSSTNINDLSSFPNCINSDHDYNFTQSNPENRPVNPLYITIFLDRRKEQLEYFRNANLSSSYLVGICFIEGCDNNDIRLLSENVMDLLNLTNANETLEIFTLSEQLEPNNPLILFFKLLPFNIVLIDIFIILFYKFIFYIFTSFYKLCCRKKIIKIKPKFGDEEKNNSLNNSFVNTKSKIKPKKNYEKYLNALFNIENNFDFLLNSETKDEINQNNNNDGLSYMIGIKGISMITLIFGFIFLDFYNIPIIKKSLDNFYEIISNPFFFPFYFGIKYAPKLLLCSSGFSLFYKFVCFLDEKTEIENELKQVNIDKSKLEKNINNFKNISNNTNNK